MKEINSIKFNTPIPAQNHLQKVDNVMGNESSNEFGQRVSDAFKSVAISQNDSAKLTKDFELGLETDLSKVMVQQQVSSLGFQLTLNVRNKLLSAYKDIMNMPV